MGKVIYSGKEIETMIGNLVQDVLTEYPDLKGVALLGIRTGGADLALRMQDRFAEAVGRKIPMGVLDINLYRDDYDMGDRQPEIRETKIDFTVRGKTILLVDDVLFTGRTIRAALEAINDYGRPAAVRLAVLIDRGWRELPIAPDYVGARVETTARERIVVSFPEGGGEATVERIELPAS
jgi:pyrimidine operon attenuation protein/uracil phosphoribosyltransferase